MKNRIKKWFDLNISWFFINGRKRKNWEKILKDKYGR